MGVLFKDGKVIDGTGRVLERGCVAVEGDRIVHVEEGTEPPSGKGWEVIDLSGKSLLPGLIDTHVHICLDASADPLAQAIKDSDAMIALKGAIHLRSTLKAGITTVRDMGGARHVDLSLREAVRSGLILGPRMLCSGKMICMTGGHGWPLGMEADGPDEIRRAVRAELKVGVDHIKLMATGGILTPGVEPAAEQLTEEELRAAIEEAHKAGRRAATHAQGTEGIKNALRAGIDTIEHGIFLDREAMENMLERGVAFIPTISALRQILNAGRKAGIPEFIVKKTEQMEASHLRSVREAKKAGLVIAMGTDAGTPFNEHGGNLRELGYLIEQGLSPMEAILSATKVASEVLGLQEMLGTIEAGKLADLIVIDGDPLADPALFEKTEAISIVMKGGEMCFRKTDR